MLNFASMSGCATLTRNLLVLLLVTGCADQSQPPEVGVKILPLGDSITQGGNGQPSYRWELSRLIKNAGYKVNFVGSHEAFDSHVGRSKRDFDLDHEGHWGWEAGQVDAQLATWLQRYDAEIVLLHLGTNDVAMGQSNSSTMDELAQIIAKLRADNPKVTILLAEIIPMQQIDTAEFNQPLRDWAIQQNTATSKIILVDQYSGYDPQKDNYDNWHPNDRGEKKMAQRWFDALEPLLATFD